MRMSSALSLLSSTTSAWPLLSASDTTNFLESVVRSPGTPIAFAIVMSRVSVLVSALAVALVVGGCASRRPTPPGAPADPAATVRPIRTQVGLASYYGEGFHGNTTASGQRFDMRQLVAAHPSFPFGTRVRVTNLANQRGVTVTIIDRGPARRHRADGVIIDLSRRAAEVLRFIRAGRQRVRVEVLAWGGK
jgi:rare lipoprotein A